MNNGWDPSYKTWTYHGEPNLPPPVIHNTTQPQMSDMTSCLNDHSYIPPNNEQNEPTQGDIGETDNKDKQLCPVCNTSRWKDNNTTGKKVPKKVLCYFLIIPRLQRLYKPSHTAKEMTWHATRKCTEPGLPADGFNPFGNLSQSYNMWPALKGVETIDVATGQKFNMAMVLLTINDFPARSSLSGWSGQDKDTGVSKSRELFALTCRPTPTPISVNSCVVNDVRFVVHSSDERRTTQNSGICSPSAKDGEMYYDMARRPPDWKVIQDVNHKKVLNGGVIMVEDDRDVIHFNNSFDLTLSTSLNDLDFATLNIDDSDDEDLANDDDDVAVVYSNLAWGHGGDGGGDDRLLPGQILTGCRRKGTRKPNRGGRKAIRIDTRGQTRNLGLWRIMNQ
nr:hypothetical protein [Tanacetum cinerariifolium]